MSLEPLTQWYCDRCDAIIKSPEEGLLEWRVDGDGKAYGFHIIHLDPYSPLSSRFHCSYYEFRVEHSHAHLTEFAGPGGLARLLSLLDPGRDEERQYTGLRVQDPRAWVQLCLRLQMPHYETARRYFGQARDDGAEEVDVTLFHTPERLLERIRHYDDEDARHRKDRPDGEDDNGGGDDSFDEDAR